MVSSVVSAQHGQLYIAGAPRFNHTGKVVIFTLTNSGNLTILYSLYGQQVKPSTHYTSKFKRHAVRGTSTNTMVPNMAGLNNEA